MGVAVTRHKNLVGGELVESTSGETMEVLNPATGETIAEVPRGTADDVERAVEAAKGAAPAWGARPPKERMELLLKPRRRDRRARGRAREARVPERRQADGDRGRRDAVLRRQPALLRRGRADARRQGRGRVRRGLHVDHPPRAARRRRRDRAVELPADDGRLEARPGARGRERPDPEARRADAADDAPLRRARPGQSCRRACSTSSPATACRSGTGSCGTRTSRSSRSPATSRPARRSPATRPTRSSACTSSSAARRRWSCSTTPIRRRSPRRSRSAATGTPARTARRPRASSSASASTTTCSARCRRRSRR